MRRTTSSRDARTVRAGIWLLSFALVATLTLAFDAPASDDDARGPSSEPPTRGTYHAQPWELERAIVDATRAVLRDDVEALREAIDRVWVLRPDEPGPDDAQFSGPFRAVDRAFRLTLGMARERAIEGDLADAAEQYRWVFVGCRRCHVQARKDGLMPNEPIRSSSREGT